MITSAWVLTLVLAGPPSQQLVALGVPPNVPLKQPVGELLKQLDAETRKARAGAEQQLRELGPNILPLLPPPELLPNASVREAVRRIRISLERRKARRSVLASRVTLRKEGPLEDLLKAVSAQTGNRIDSLQVPVERRQTPFEVDYEQLAFWPVMDDLVARCGLRYADGSGPRSLKLSVRPKSGPPDEIAAAHCGAFRISVASAGLRRIVGDETHRKLRVSLRLAAEPRLRPLFLKLAGRDLVARTPAGRALEPFSPDSSLELPLGRGGRQLAMHADFKVPAAVRLSRAGLRGKLTMQTAAGMERISFRTLPDAEGVSRRRGGVTVTLKKVAFREKPRAERDLALEVGVSYDTGGPAFETHRTWIFHNEVYLETEEGRRVDLNGGYETKQQSDGGVAVVYRFKQLKDEPGGYRFVYVAPTLIINVPVEFDFTELPVLPLAEERG